MQFVAKLFATPAQGAASSEPLGATSALVRVLRSCSVSAVSARGRELLGPGARQEDTRNNFMESCH